MPKVNDPHLIQIELRGKRAKISQAGYELSPDEWHRRRQKAFAQLRKFGGIPSEILNAVENFGERQIVDLFVSRTGEEVALRFGAKILPDKTDRKKRLSEMVANGKRINRKPADGKMNASEALAFLLRIQLRSLKHEEREKRGAPVRTLNHVPRSLIAEIAMDLLGSCETWEYAPGPLLASLIREILNVDHDRQGMPRDVERQELAASIIAQAPKVGTRELAKALKVNASTISRWRRSPDFKLLVAQKVDSFKQLSKVGDKIENFSQENPIQKKTIALLLSTAARLFETRKNKD